MNCYTFIDQLIFVYLFVIIPIVGFWNDSKQTKWHCMVAGRRLQPVQATSTILSGSIGAAILSTCAALVHVHVPGAKKT